MEFDDGDTGRIPLSHIRLLPPDYKIHCEREICTQHSVKGLAPETLRLVLENEKGESARSLWLSFTFEFCLFFSHKMLLLRCLFKLPCVKPDSGVKSSEKNGDHEAHCSLKKLNIFNDHRVLIPVFLFGNL